ncbi:hypothetical protein NM688_g6569 [Phlebia brevispora]|uniref:Uncharacterized protein n=1 Tax=Phlebia brevispora TaxID=194682 RepID=A0ACC1SEI3_9APHY|nr:hypothetical protein NM688_g6569 [Phlebia brevispora]
MPLPLQRAMGELQRKEASPFDIIPAYVKRSTNEMPEELPSKSPAGTVEPYSRRDTNTIPAEQPTMSPDATHNVTGRHYGTLRC